MRRRRMGGEGGTARNDASHRLVYLDWGVLELYRLPRRLTSGRIAAYYVTVWVDGLSCWRTIGRVQRPLFYPPSRPRRWIGVDLVGVPLGYAHSIRDAAVGLAATVLHAEIEAMRALSAAAQMRDVDDCDDEEDGPCWCGEAHPAYLTEGLDASCGGSGVLYCYCGGDQCVCHHHGEIECPGCDDCDGNGDDPGNDSDPDGFDEPDGDEWASW